MLLKRALLALVVVAATAALAQAQEDDGVRIIRINLMPDEGQPAGLFPSLFSQVSQPRRRLFPSFPSFLSRFFGDNNEDSDEEAPQLATVFNIDTGAADEQPQQPQPEPFPFGRLFMRVSSMVNALTSQMLHSDMKASHRHARCPLVRACGDDVDEFCADARTSDTPGAVQMCLKAHEEQLSERCATVLREHLEKKKKQDKQQEQQQEQQPQQETEQKPEQQDEDAPKAEDHSHPRLPCMEDVQKHCPGKQVQGGGFRGVVECLHSFRDELTPECRASMEKRPMFQCAADTKALCAGAKGRHAVLLCLLKAGGRELLSEECAKALGPALERKAVEGASARAAVVSSSKQPSGFHPRLLRTNEQASGKAATDAVATPASHTGPRVPVEAWLGLGAFVAVAMIALVVRQCRRTRRAAAAKAEAEVLQLVSPTKGVVDAAAPTFVPPPAEQL